MRCGSHYPVLTQSPVCWLCETAPRPFQSEHAFWEYSGVVREVINAMKYRPSVALCAFLSREIARFVRQEQIKPEWDLLVPMPMAPSNSKQRGFNPCKVLAHALRKELKLKIPIEEVLHRKANSKPQASLSTAGRLRNSRRLFQQPSVSLAGMRVLLVEDVVTTGASSMVAGTTLLAAGAISVHFLCIARAPEWFRWRNLVFRSSSRKIG